MDHAWDEQIKYDARQKEDISLLYTHNMQPNTD